VPRGVRQADVLPAMARRGRRHARTARGRGRPRPAFPLDQPGEAQALAARLASWPGKALITRDQLPSMRAGAGLPTLRRLCEPQRDVAWRLTGGHPRAVEYLAVGLAADLPWSGT
jgi:hypothetical protein